MKHCTPISRGLPLEAFNFVAQQEVKQRMLCAFVAYYLHKGPCSDDEEA